MEQKIEQFIKAKEHVLNTVEQKVELFLTGSWDPLIRHTLIKETVDIIQNELIELFPDIPVKYLPRCRFRIFEEDMHIEAGIQCFYNHEPELMFLGTIDIADEIFDCYFRQSYDPSADYMFIARYGHGQTDYQQGSKTAIAEYYLGQYTPLSLTYGLAIEDGFIG